jgi:hypothetical protein
MASSSWRSPRLDPSPDERERRRGLTAMQPAAESSSGGTIEPSGSWRRARPGVSMRAEEVRCRPLEPCFRRPRSPHLSGAPSPSGRGSIAVLSGAAGRILNESPSWSHAERRFRRRPSSRCCSCRRSPTSRSRPGSDEGRAQATRVSRPGPARDGEAKTWLVSPLGFEPRTKGLKVPCSTAELRAHRLKGEITLGLSR